MNERNVEALTDALMDINISIANRACFRRFAEKLAALGVLVPSSLCDVGVERMLEAGVHIYGDAQDGWGYDYEAEPLKLALERIAKGESA